MFRGDFTSNTKLTDTNNSHRRINHNNFMLSTAKRTTAVTERQPVEEDIKPLHNFNLPCLKWGNQKLLRCMKVDSNADVSVIHRNHSSDTNNSAAGGGVGGGYVFSTQRRKRLRSSDDDRKTESFCYKLPAPEKLKSRMGIGIGVAGDGEIEATREKLMFDFQKEVGKMKEAILGVDPPPPPAPAATAPTYDNPPADRPWNLRTRRAACKAPRSPTNAVACNGEVFKPNSSPVTNECKIPKLRLNNGEKTKTERPKFSVSLSRREVEEDFMAISGRRLPRKPKKRPRIVQKQLDTLFPGLWLSEITADLYKVPDETDTGKR